ncbi:LacI family DNA-binding transcriptional regulator [Ferrovibrio xuzhouensis]|uniref:LacI family DNA-binding transcriptional regulator n=1 Tax=Ferrovibrio xuzhouensis TaxID=1576914 RepID=A0ABV7VHD3_9PROT
MDNDTLPATLKDVARLARVSLATVDRVLHGRAGVRAATMHRVQDAVEQLGFRPHAAAAELARARRFRFAYVMPRGSNVFMHQIGEGLKEAKGWLAARRAIAEVIETDVFDPAVLAATLNGFGDRYSGVAVVALDHPLVRAAIDDLVARGVHVVTLVSDAPNSRRAHYVGIDNAAAGRTAASLLGRFLGGSRGKVGIIAGSFALRDHAERLSGFMQVMTGEYPHLQVLGPEEGRDDPARNAAIARRMLATHRDLVGIYNIGAGPEGIAAALTDDARPQRVLFIAHESMPATRRFLTLGIVDALVHQDPGHEARSAARVLLSLCSGEAIQAAQEKIRIEIIMRDNMN